MIKEVCWKKIQVMNLILFDIWKSWYQEKAANTKKRLKDVAFDNDLEAGFSVGYEPNKNHSWLSVVLNYRILLDYLKIAGDARFIM